MISVCNFIAKIEIQIKWRYSFLQLFEKLSKYGAFGKILRLEVLKF